MSLSIKNVYGFEDVLNVSINVKIPEELEINSTFIDNTILTDLDLENVTDELDHDFGLLPVDNTIRFKIIYNVTSTETKSIAIPSINITYRLESGITGFVKSNSEDIRLSGKKLSTTTESLLPIPIGTINELNLVFMKFPAASFFSFIGYLFPLLSFSMSIIVLRRIRYVKT